MDHLENILGSNGLINLNRGLSRWRIIEQNSSVDDLHPALSQTGKFNKRLIGHLIKIPRLNLAKYAVEQTIVSAREGKKVGTNAMAQEQRNLLTAQAQDFGYLMCGQIQELSNLIDARSTQGQITHEPKLASVQFGHGIIKFDLETFPSQGLDDAMFDIALVG